MSLDEKLVSSEKKETRKSFNLKKTVGKGFVGLGIFASAAVFSLSAYSIFLNFLDGQVKEISKTENCYFKKKGDVGLMKAYVTFKDKKPYCIMLEKSSLPHEKDRFHDANGDMILDPHEFITNKMKKYFSMEKAGEYQTGIREFNVFKKE